MDSDEFVELPDWPDEGFFWDIVGEFPYDLYDDDDEGW